MKQLRLFGLLIIAAHALVAVWHLLLTPMVLPALAHIAIGTPLALFVAAHAVVLLAWWFLPQRRTSAFLFVVFAVALIFGSYEHFISAEPNNIFHLSAGPGVLAFRISSVLLFLLELSGCVLALYSARIHRNPAPAS
jgi:hypothetical protein